MQLLLSSILLLTTVTGEDSCFVDPSQTKCRDISEIYTDKDIEHDLDSLCMMMSELSGCRVRHFCFSSPKGANGATCEKWTLLTDVCSSHGGAAMSGMTGCQKYNELCDNSSTVVQACTTHTPTPSLVLAKTARQEMLTMCSSMSGMAGCDTCTSAAHCPHPLDSLSQACLAMPGMEKCDDWTTMCQQNMMMGKGSMLPKFCDPQFNTTTNQCNAGAMKMYFHGGIHDVVLFKEWYACNVGQYTTVLCVVFFVAFLSSSFRTRRKHVENSLFVFLCKGNGCSKDTTSNATTRRAPLLPPPSEIGYRVTLGVDGMTCESCTGTVRDAVRRSTPLTTTTLIELRVTLEHEGIVHLVLQCEPEMLHAHINTIRESIVDVGYDVRSTTDPVVRGSDGEEGEGGAKLNLHSPYPRNAVKAMMTGLQLTVDYALMLAAMTFNTGVFVSIVLGYSSTTLLFGHLENNKRVSPLDEGDDFNNVDLPECCQGGHNY